MIEPTAEMVVAAITALRETVLDDEVTVARAIAEAVLAIVERDHDVRDRVAVPAVCGAVHPTAPYDCERPPGHSERHLSFSGPVIVW